jgi:hypothetical protein
MRKFPALVYRCPGPYPGPHGKTFDTRPVASPEALAEAVRDGWHWSLEDASLGLSPPAPVEAQPALAEAPPEAPQELIDERALLLAQAEKLGIDVDGRWSERRLRREIEAAIQATAI